MTEPQIKITKLNHSQLKVICEMDIALEISESFKFEVKGAKFSPAFKMGRWDGFIRLFNIGSRTIGTGLFEQLIKFCSTNNYEYELIESEYGMPGDAADISYDEVSEYMKSLNASPSGVPLVIRDYQIKGVHTALTEKNCVLLSATGSGKSFIIACIFRYITEVLGGRCLLIVPTVGLTTQMYNDFKDYFSSTGYNVEENVHLISAGVDKNINKKIVISTFQSLKTVNKDWLNSFTCIMSDEGHKIQSDSFKTIYDAATEVPYRLACTGTLHDTKCDVLQIQALTGPVREIALAKDLIAAGQLVPLKIKGIILKYPDDICKAFKKVEYEDEIGWITNNKSRDKFIRNLSNSCVGTTLILFRFKEHGRNLYDIIKLSNPERKVFFIDGDIKASEREQIRLDGNNEDCIIVASYGVFSTGANLPAIENIIIAHPTRGGITYLQTIGRGLRLKSGKTHCKLFDIGDNLTWKNKVNHTYRHFGERLTVLTREGYTFNLVNVQF